MRDLNVAAQGQVIDMELDRVSRQLTGRANLIQEGIVAPRHLGFANIEMVSSNAATLLETHR